MTSVQQILARVSGRSAVNVGDYVMIRPDLLIMHELFIYPQTIEAMDRIGLDRIWDPQRTMVVFDHAIPAPSSKWAHKHKRAREWVQQQQIKYFHDMGGGISHQIAAELGLVRPGMFVANGDPHVTAYGGLGAFAPTLGSQTQLELVLTGETWYQVPPTIRFTLDGHLPIGVTARDAFVAVMNEVGVDGALEASMLFTGSAVEHMDIDQRMTLCDLAPLAGAANAIVEPDAVTAAYVSARTHETWEASCTGKGEIVARDVFLEVDTLPPLICRPPDPLNGVPITEIERRPIDQGFIGSCAGGRLDELRLAAQVLRGRKVRSGTRLLITPASQEIHLKLIRDGLAEVFVSAGATLSSPGCGACMGFTGALDDGEVCVANSTQNLQGRMGSLAADIYLANAAVVAASCVEGSLADPRPYLD